MRENINSVWQTWNFKPISDKIITSIHLEQTPKCLVIEPKTQQRLPLVKEVLQSRSQWSQSSPLKICIVQIFYHFDLADGHHSRLSCRCPAVFYFFDWTILYVFWQSSAPSALTESNRDFIFLEIDVVQPCCHWKANEPGSSLSYSVIWIMFWDEGRSYRCDKSWVQGSRKAPVGDHHAPLYSI